MIFPFLSFLSVNSSSASALNIILSLIAGGRAGKLRHQIDYFPALLQRLQSPSPRRQWQESALLWILPTLRRLDLLGSGILCAHRLRL